MPDSKDAVIGSADEMTFDEPAAVLREMSGETPATKSDRLRTISDSVDTYEAICAKTKGARPMATIWSHLRLLRPSVRC